MTDPVYMFGKQQLVLDVQNSKDDILSFRYEIPGLLIQLHVDPKETILHAKAILVFCSRHLSRGLVIDSSTESAGAWFHKTPESALKALRNNLSDVISVLQDL